MDFPPADAAVLSNVLEHVDDPVGLLKKALAAADRAIVNVPKRNEALWEMGIAEYHQLDKTHRHCGFSQDEIRRVVALSGGRLTALVEHGQISGSNVIGFFRNRAVRKVLRSLAYRFPRYFSTLVFNTEMLCVVEKDAPLSGGDA
ncbi:MAG: hypothetical protein Kow0025_12730 [Thermodesulfovibrionales bacterium]